MPRLLLLTDALIVVLFLVFPFIMGGREAWGHRVLVTLAFALGSVWCLHRCNTGGRLRLMALEPLLVAGLLVVWVQTVALSPDVLKQLSPEYKRLIPAWASTQLDAEGNPGTAPWNTASFYPTETRHAFLILLSYGVIGIVLAQRLQSESDCRKLLKLIAFSGILMAAFAMLQQMTSNDKFFWFYQHPYTGTREVLKGAFTNRNHFAQFLALTIGPLLWWMLAGREVKKTSTVLERKGLGPAEGNHSRFDDLIDAKLLLLMCAAGGVILSVMLSLSRGGMVSAGVACSVCLAGLWRSGKVRSSLAAVMVALGVIAIGGIVVFGQDKVETRVSQLASADADKIDQMNARRTIWKADLKAIKAFPILGTGVGSHRHVYRIYMDELAEFSGVTFSHAESTYIHLALETGLAGVALLALGLLFILGRLLIHLVRRTEPERIAGIAAVMAALLGGVIHAAFDFIWYVPAIVVVTMALAITGLRLCSGFHQDAGIPCPRIAWMAGGIACLLMLGLSQPDLARRVAGERLWHQYLIVAKETIRSLSEEASPVLGLEQKQAETDQPAFQERGTEIAQYEDKPESPVYQPLEDSLRRQIALLMESVRVCPNQADATCRLAKKSLDLFEILQTRSDNPLPLPHIRDAVLASQFESTEAMEEFLKKAFGPPVKLLSLSDQMSRRSLALCPLQDEPYKYLVSVGFVRDPQDRLNDRMMAQTLRLGQNSPSTRFAVGESLLLAGKLPEALRHWNVVFHSTSEMRKDICRRLGRKFAVDVVLMNFDPSVDELIDVVTVYSTYHRQQDLQNLVHVVEEKTRFIETKKDSAANEGHEQHLALLMKTNLLASELRDYENSEVLLRRAIKAVPAAEPPHRALGLLMLEMERFDEAEEQFAWCYDQMPGDTKLQELRRECKRLQAVKDRKIRSASLTKRRKTAE
ncbi:MAG: O-antigen ligase family protein [Planctomycetaceae bacterium]|nr:O-antigen ligase family protein [Planctomycetaceae bacterium]